MSETVRSFTGSDLAIHHRTHRSHRGTSRNIVLAAVVIFGLYSCYATRDSAPMEQFIPSSQAYHAFANDVQAKREAIASSALWNLLPPSMGGAAMAARIGQDVGMPDWILRNLIPSVVYVSGEDTANWSDVLLVSRMTRIGRVLCAFRCLLPGVEEDYAGGLRMAYVKEAQLHFAVRGRTLLASPSREAIIRSLTLEPKDAIKKGTMTAKSSSDDSGAIQGAVTLTAADPLGNILQGVSFALHADKARAQLKCRAVLSAAWQEKLGGLLAGLEPRDLTVPPEGPIQLSLDMNKPLCEFGAAVLDVFNQRAEFDRYWASWSASAPMLSQVASTLLGPLGPGLRLSCQGMDLNEMIPVPKLIMAIDAPNDAIIGTYAKLPPFPSPVPGDWIPHYDPEKRIVALSLIGGPSMEPAAGMAGSSLVLSNCRPLVENLMANPPKEDKLPRKANLYIRIAPRTSVEAAAGLVQLLAENHFVKGYSAEQIGAFFGPWLEHLAKIGDMSASLAFHGGEIVLDLNAE